MQFIFICICVVFRCACCVCACVHVWWGVRSIIALDNDDDDLEFSRCCDQGFSSTGMIFPTQIPKVRFMC